MATLDDGSESPDARYSDSVTEAQRELDADFVAMHLTFCSINEKHNAHSPVSRLPVELLTRIFHLVAISERAGDVLWRTSFRDPIGSRLGWIKVTFVCRRWREVALGCAKLWSNVPLSLAQDLPPWW
ncbi:hypothetical protein BV25DRAFT_1835461 [Artomyces pyxidatus]|uniref:Uncharacterized protein n=1 Tax=Artomyces pyxidatus TaxID=48021 RepID=A0ACB8TD82_9AGAM|nr:hypothetical protein BV25DRAFT_1835461 [Artomyces pyxidatus]